MKWLLEFLLPPGSALFVLLLWACLRQAGWADRRIEHLDPRNDPPEETAARASFPTNKITPRSRTLP